MNFSVFEYDDDDTFGDLANARSVVLKGTTTVNALFNSSAFPIGDWFKRALEGAGFEVTNVRWSWNSSIPFGGNAANVEIEVELFNWHTSDEARVNAIRAIEAYT